jgi:hypothetical protein
VTLSNSSLRDFGVILILTRDRSAAIKEDPVRAVVLPISSARLQMAGLRSKGSEC